MTVQDLILQLQNFHPDNEVFIINTSNTHVTTISGLEAGNTLDEDENVEKYVLIKTQLNF